MSEQSPQSQPSEASTAIRQCLNQLVVLTQAAEQQTFDADLQVVIRAIGVVAEQLLHLVEPVLDAEEAPAPTPPTSASILIVADQPANLRLASNLLRNWGFKVFTAASTEAAQHECEVRQQDVVLIDFDTTRFNAAALCRNLKQGEQFGSPIVMALTAHAPSADEPATAAGADAVLRIPFTEEHLLRRLELILHAAPELQTPAAPPISGPANLNLSLLEANAIEKPGFVLNMLRLAEEMLPVYLTSLMAAFQSDAFGDVRFNANKIKSSAIMLGASELSGVMQTIEDAIETGHIEDVLPILLDEATRLCQETLQAIQKALLSYESTSTDTPVH